jgi:hypothetical protein
MMTARFPLYVTKYSIAPGTGKQVLRVINQFSGYGMDGLIKPIAIDRCRVLISTRAAQE